MNPTQRIVPMNKEAGWLEARKLTREKGGLPSNVLYDDCLVRSGNWINILRSFPAWAREMLVHPEKDGKFKKGMDVVDSGTGWVLPWGEIVRLVSPESIIGPKVGLFVDPGIDPENVQVEKYKGKDAKVVHPQSIKVLSPFIQESRSGGKVDEETRVPLEIDPALWESLPEEEKRWLDRIEGVGVSHLVRGSNSTTREWWQGIFAMHYPDDLLSVAYVESSVLGLEGALQVEKATGDEGILVKGITLGEFRELCGDASAELLDVLETVRPEKLRALRQIVQVLDSSSDFSKK